MKEKQENPAFASNVQRYGCYFFCLLRMAELEAGRELSADGINLVYFDCIDKAYIIGKCSCDKPDGIAQLALNFLESKKKIFQIGKINAEGKPTFWGWARKKPYNNPKYVALCFSTGGPIGTHYVLAAPDHSIIFDPSEHDYTRNAKLGGLLHAVVGG